MLLKKINNYISSILFSKLELAQKTPRLKTRAFLFYCKKKSYA